jgi:3-oxoacyl-[acyl-carrier-protein] synthase-3
MKLRFENVRLAALAHALPEERVTSEELERALAPLYERLRLRVGRLELMSGIRERRFWPHGFRPSDAAALAGGIALERGGLERARIGALVHASVSRDFLEPATASVVHSRLGLAPDCQVFDLSNACLGVLNGMTVVGGLIEAGQIEAGLIVAGEDGRGLVEETLATLLASSSAVKELKNELKRAFASLTIGSGAAAVLLAHARLAPRAPRLVGGALAAASEHVELCQGDRVAASSGATMSTDSEALLQAGVGLAQRTFAPFLTALDWSREGVARVVTHQVGSAHRRLLFERLELDLALDHPTFERLGNTGSAALPTALSLALEERALRAGERVALLGIGSGLHCLMLGLEG